MLTAELIITMPIVVGMIFAMIEIGMILVGQQQIENAARIGCRVGTFPGDTTLAGDTCDPNITVHDVEVRAAIIHALGGSNTKLAQEADIDYTYGENPGDHVTVTIKVPMSAAAPDMLAFLGFSLDGPDPVNEPEHVKYMTARCVMRRE